MDSSVTYEKLWHLQHGPQNNAALKSSVLWRMTQQRLESLLNRYPELGYRKVLAVPQRRRTVTDDDLARLWAPVERW